MNEKFLIRKPFDELYPLTDEDIEKIVLCIDDESNIIFDNYSFLIGQNLEIAFHGETSDDYTVWFVNKNGSIKLPSVKKITEVLEKNGYPKAYIVCSSLSTSARNFINQTLFYRIVSIDQVIHPDFRKTIPIFLGRHANSIEENIVRKKNLMLRVPLVGYPEYGLGGSLSAQDIYNFIKSGGANHSYESDGFGIFMEVFKELHQSLVSGKNITPTRWESILNKHGLIDYIKKGGK